MVEKYQVERERFDRIYSTLNLCNKSLSELNFISNIVYTDDEIDLLNSYSFEFYKVTLQYCHNIEYCKLFEDGPSDELQLGSIVKLNKCLLNNIGTDFQNSFRKNEGLVNSILKSDFYNRQLNTRDKGKPESAFNTFNYQEVQEAFEHLLIVKEILTSCANLLEINFDIRIPNSDTRTIDFIMDYSVFKKFYYNNYMKLLD